MKSKEKQGFLPACFCFLLFVWTMSLPSEPSFFSLPTWTEDWPLSSNPLPPQCQIWAAEACRLLPEQLQVSASSGCRQGWLDHSVPRVEVTLINPPLEYTVIVLSFPSGEP